MQFTNDPLKLPKSTFVEQFGGVYEHSAWVAEKAFDDGLPSGVESMIATLRAIIEAAGEAPQLALLRAHPDLAGKLAKTGELTAESTSEQAGAGLDECTPEEFAEFTHLNDTYKTKFGFPYILAVKGRHRVEILDNFRARVDNSTQQEFREALDQVHQIARLRLEALTI
ncbi:MAG: 2-oxo-4-hydroxy-4-carboxy-5-ureidoimidazoline decarboxylase [Rhodobacteraceae bacterium]|nr:2-oxo-4-hydroxy-4-carboxy-5-ureidoimidazoline decarboxylase [Paracoccaceae bacterium]